MVGDSRVTQELHKRSLCDSMLFAKESKPPVITEETDCAAVQR